MNSGKLSIWFHLSSESMWYSHLRAGRSAALFRHTVTLNTEETPPLRFLTLFELSGECRYNFLLYYKTELSLFIPLLCFGYRNNMILFAKI